MTSTDITGQDTTPTHHLDPMDGLITDVNVRTDHDPWTVIAQLSNAVVSRSVVGQAQGILMERYRLTAADALRRLQQVARRSGDRLGDVAAELVATGSEPDEAGGSGD